MRWSLIASSLAALGVAAMLFSAAGAATAGAAAANPTGYWKLSLRVDYTSSGTATKSRCDPNPEQAAPSPVSSNATQTLTVRTTRPAHVEFHAAPNGVPVATETAFAKPFRAKVSESRAGDVSSDGEPKGCYGGPPEPPMGCPTKTVNSGLYVNPLGGIHGWKGFTVQLQESPAGDSNRCGLTGAQGKLAEPLTIDVVAKPSKLTGKAGKLVFRGSKSFRASDQEESTKSTATGRITWIVTLRRAGAYG